MLKLSNIYENLCLVLDNEDDKPVEKACHKMCTTSRAGFIENDQSNFIIFDFPKVDVRKAEFYFDLERYAIVPEIDFFFKDASGTRLTKYSVDFVSSYHNNSNLFPRDSQTSAIFR